MNKIELSFLVILILFCLLFISGFIGIEKNFSDSELKVNGIEYGKPEEYKINTLLNKGTSL
ncbi:MAG: hypothetical protein KO202_00705 [Methanobacteriaceae archaeon]|jgi:hypothetical protein|nr:hypothetical protein [Methanobacteriaceae archaeon]